MLLFLFLVCTYPSFTELLLTATVARRLAYTEQDAFNYYLMTLAKSCPETSSFRTASDAMSTIVLFGEQQAKFTHFCLKHGRCIDLTTNLNGQVDIRTLL